MVVRQLINHDINRKAFLLFTRRTDDDILRSRNGWFIKGFGINLRAVAHLETLDYSLSNLSLARQ